MTDIHEIARTLFDAHQNERVVRGDYIRSGSNLANAGGRPEQWTELSIDEQDCWVAVARVAQRSVEAALDAALGEVRRQGGPEYLLVEARGEGLAAARIGARPTRSVAQGSFPRLKPAKARRARKTKR